MKILNILIILLIFILNSCCTNDNSIEIYKGHYHIGDNIKIIVNDGDLEFTESFKGRYDEEQLLKKYCCKNDSVKIYIKVNQYDTTCYFKCSEIEKFDFISNTEGKIYIITDKDKEYWEID